MKNLQILLFLIISFVVCASANAQDGVVLNKDYKAGKNGYFLPKSKSFKAKQVDDSKDEIIRSQQEVIDSQAEMIKALLKTIKIMSSDSPAKPETPSPEADEPNIPFPEIPVGSEDEDESGEFPEIPVDDKKEEFPEIPAESKELTLNEKAFALFDSKCAKCHLENKDPKGNFTLMGKDDEGFYLYQLTSKETEDVWRVVSSGKMPKEGDPLNETELSVIKLWLEKVRNEE